MPTGYQCDECETFDRHEHRMTEIDVGLAAAEDGTRMEPTYVLCPECATDLREDIMGVTVPEEARDAALK